MRAPLPADEDRRLAALRDLRMSLSEPDERFDELTRRIEARLPYCRIRYAF